MKKCYAAVLLSFILLTAGLTAKTQVISQLSFYSPLISTFDMKYANNHLVVSQNGLLIFDVTDPNKKPKLVAQRSYPGSTARAIAVQNKYTYMAFGNNGIFAVYDISNFNAPVLKGSVAIPAASFYGVGDLEPHGNYVYMSGFDSLYIINVSNASSPKVENVIPVSHTEFGGAEDMVIDQSAIFVRTPLAIQVFDINNPVTPVLIDTIPNTHFYNQGLSVDTVRHRIFSPWLTPLKEFMGYDAYNVSNPSTPKFLFRDSVVFGGGEFGISDYSYFDNVLFLSKGGGIDAFDVSKSAHGLVTEFVGQDIPNSSISIQVRDSVFFHARGGGLEVLKYSGTKEEVCLVPENLKQQVNGTTANLRWGKVDGVLGYIVRYRAIGTNDWKYSASKNNTEQLTDLTPGTTYTWEVRSACDSSRRGLSDWSLYNVFQVHSPKINELVSFAPNPVRDVLRVHIKDLSVSQIVITDLAGSALIKINPAKQDENISFSKLRPGNYVLQLLDRNNNLIRGTIIFRQ